MKIAITSTGESLDSSVDQRFGRCRFFLLIDPDTMDFQAISNASAMESGGAGIKAAQTVADAGAKVVITGDVGPNAFRTLSAAGIEIITGATGTVHDNIEMYKQGGMSAAGSPTVESHAGMGGR